MSEDSNNDQTGDDELAPMVDGLSGALCIFILITTVFMISGIETVVTGTGRIYSAHVSQVDYSRNIIYFDKILSLSKGDYLLINDSIHRSAKKNIVLEASSRDINNPAALYVKRNLTYNLLEFKKYIDARNVRVTLKISDEDFCQMQSSCIKWSVN
ncbi:hypothetical protein CRB79_004624 [Salmonella enterica subsp. enterica serovar Enteritidis]|nr:hypothetical protein [Salmonella enterica subsp. enterica serovar Enteritidis]EGT9239802.1 hypothetical protein [Salmonella enterica]